MKTRPISILAMIIGLVVTPALSAGESEPQTVEELFRRSAEAYQPLSVFEVVMTTSAEIPGLQPEENVVRYLLGRGNRALLDIGSRMRVVVTDDRVYAQHSGHPDRVLSLPYEGDLADALAAARGRSTLAGFWVPPQAALRAEKPIADVVDAFRYSRRLGELTVSGFEQLAGPVYEIAFDADNGSCRARFDGSTFYLEEVEYLVSPPGAPEGYAMRLSCRFSTRVLEDDGGAFDFSVGEKTVVESLRDLSPPAPGIDRPPAEVLAPEALAARQMDIEELARAIRGRRVLLFGEDHLYEEPPAYAIALLEQLGDTPVSLLLEMPADVQHDIDRYLKAGDEKILDEIFTGRPVLQLQQLLRWAHKNPRRVLTVKAMDEPMYEIQLKRSYLADTRNVTMSAAIYREWKTHPDRIVVAYAGSLHLMKAGRYRLNQPSRRPAGARIVDLGLPANEIAVVMMNGDDNFHLHSVWREAGVLAVDGGPVRIPIAYFIDYPIFEIEYADEAFDYFVNLGPLTRIEVK